MALYPLEQAAFDLGCVSVKATRPIVRGAYLSQLLVTARWADWSEASTFVPCAMGEEPWAIHRATIELKGRRHG